MYKELEPAVFVRGEFAVYELAYPVGGRTHTMWGLDITGRRCRCAAFFDVADAVDRANMSASAREADIDQALAEETAREK
jgi:hypothetical protein